MSEFGDIVQSIQQGLFESLVQPLLYRLGQGNLLEDGYEATLWLLVGLAQIAVMILVLGPMQRRWPIEPISDRAAIRVDIIYTLIHRLGVFRLLMFFLLDPLTDALFGSAHVWGMRPLQLDEWLPALAANPLLGFLAYLVVFDFVDYLIHRGQHQLGWWWSLHALHHSQRQMTMWSDARNHLLDDVIRSLLLALVAQLIGVPPGQFVAVVVITGLVESLAHANLRLGFGRVGERLLVGPVFHRLHHAIGVGHENPNGVRGGRNYAVLFPVWDMLLGTADFDQAYRPTGVRDQLPGEGERDYGRGFWSQQWLGLLRLLGAGGPAPGVRR